MAAIELAKSRSIHLPMLRLCRQVIDGSLAPETAVNQLIALHEQSPTFSSLLYDVISIIDSQIDETGTGTEQLEDVVKRFRELLSRMTSLIIPDDIMRVDLDILGATSDQAIRSRVVKARTRLYYKQIKFNLLREESEGYAKLICELIDCNFDITPKAALGRIHRLIGQFNLDPNRVMDIVLECFECAPARRSFFTDLLKELKSDREDLCHMLGFKFTFYQKSEDTPLSLYNVAAALCHADMLDMLQLCLYLIPRQDQLLNDHKQMIEAAMKRAKKAEIISTAALPIDSKQNGSLASGAEESAAAPPVQGMPFAAVSAAQEAQDPTEDDTAVLAWNQKLGLCCALLEMGDWQLAKQLLDRFPEFYAVNASKRIAMAITDIVGAAIDDFYKEKCKSYQVCADIRRSQRKTPTNVTMGSAAIIEGPLEIIGSWADLNSILVPVLNYLGPHIAYRPLVASKLVRLMAAFFLEKARQTDPDLQAHYEQLSYVLIDVCDGILVPSLSLSEASCAFSEELWALLSGFPYTLRYRMYGRWKNIHTSRHGQLQIQRGKTIGRTRYVVKRLSKETIKMMGRQLGKLCHLHAPVVFDYLLNQIQTFENLIGPVVESIRFLTSLEFDVLSYCIIEQLGSPDKQQLKASDATFSPWLQALSNFTATVFKKYNMELTGVLQYVANQLKNGKSFDLLVLRDIIQNMSGIETTTGLTQEQLEALAGGELLRQEAGSFGIVKNVRRATGRLRDALIQEDLIVGLCILTAQQRSCIVFQESEGIPLKLACQMLDQCQETLVQFGSFLWANLKTEDYVQRMPTAPELISQYMLQPDAAMFLSRPSYMHSIITRYQREKKEAEEKLGGENKGPLSSDLKYAIYSNAFDSVLKPLENALRPLFPDSHWKDVTTRLFSIFWSLSLYDLNVPTAAYEREIEKVKKAIATAAENAENASKKSKSSKEEDRLKALEAKLSDECRSQTEHVARIKQLLLADKYPLFVRCEGLTRIQNTSRFLQVCVLPRAILTDMDAVYCAKFVELLHLQRAPNFSTILFLSRILGDPLPLYAGLTENEAGCLGRFLCLLLGMVMRWHGDKAIFDKECYQTPGFSAKPIIKMSLADSLDSKSFMDHDEFRGLCFRWSLRMSRAFIAVLQGGNYVQMRNTMAILIKILPHYPIVQRHYQALEGKAVKARDAEKGKRDDLSLMAASYAGQLKMRKARTIVEEEFCSRIYLGPKKTVAAAGAVPANSANTTSTPAATSVAERRAPVATAASSANETTPATHKKIPAEPPQSPAAEPVKERKRAVPGIAAAMEPSPIAVSPDDDQRAAEVVKKKQKLATGATAKGRETTTARKEEGEIVEEASPKAAATSVLKKTRSAKSVDEIIRTATFPTASSSSSRTVLSSEKEKTTSIAGEREHRKDKAKKATPPPSVSHSRSADSSGVAVEKSGAVEPQRSHSSGKYGKRSAVEAEFGDGNGEGGSSSAKAPRKSDAANSSDRRATKRDEASPHSAKYGTRDRRSKEKEVRGTRDKDR